MRIQNTSRTALFVDDNGGYIAPGDFGECDEKVGQRFIKLEKAKEVADGQAKAKRNGKPKDEA